MDELVSICIPTYNGENHLKASIKSAINQTHANIEILIVDDQSTDLTVSIIHDFMERDNRIRLVENEKNLGLVGNWNKCISFAKGNWVKLHFQDDLMVNDTIEKMLTLAKQQNVEFVLSDREYFFEDGMDSDYYEKLQRLSNHFESASVIQPKDLAELFSKLSIEHNFIGEPILGLFNKSVLDTCGKFEEKMFQLVDFEFWFRLMSNIETGFIAEKLHQFRVHSKSQGAKNMGREGINVSDLDMVLMAHKICTDSNYEKLRNFIGPQNVMALLSPLVESKLEKNGWFRMKKKIGSEVLKYFNPPLKVKIKALKKDVSMYF
ncbi:glycosyltransferase family 2 protein [Ekhidna sp.]|uniref:glycosyltransferase family 2 protein n=1 Tax=Ekhidna sp. TaxID=2608089 RepID=UPI003B51214A